MENNELQKRKNASDKSWVSYCQQEYLLTEQGKRFVDVCDGIFRDADESRLIQLIGFFNEKEPLNLEEAANQICHYTKYRYYFKQLVKSALRLGYLTKPGEKPDLEFKIRQEPSFLGNKITKRIYDYIKENPGTYPGRILHELIINSSALYKNLKILESGKLITSEKKDKHTHYYAANKT